jgi:phosphotransferase system enzyme I (PtsI)
MLPMISSIDEIIKAKDQIKKYEKELTDSYIKVGTYKIGIMIEIPSICILAKEAAEIVDFASFGTNDLCQYLMAVDRLNPLVAKYYQNYNPALLRLMKYAVDAFKKANKPISVCGELGGDILAGPVLVGMGMRKLSMSSSKVAHIKQLLSEFSSTQLERIAKKVLKFSSEEEVVTYLSKQFKKYI